MKKKTKSSKEVMVKTSKDVLPMWTQEQVDLIKNTVAKGATDDELKLFLYTAKRTGLDPLTKQIHFVKRGGQMTIQTGIDGYRAIAERTKSLAGITDPLYEVVGDKPVKATVKVYRSINGMMAEFTASARFTEYVAPYSPLWNKMPFLMLGKCAEALALRKAFPNDLSGLYTNEEMAQAEAKPILPQNSQPQSISEEGEPIVDITPPPKKISDKTKIAHLVKVLKITDPTPEKMKAITGLEFVEENYPEIVGRLETIYEDSKEQQ